MRSFIVLSLLVIQAYCSPVDPELINSRDPDKSETEGGKPFDENALAALLGDIADVRVSGSDPEGPQSEIVIVQPVDDKNYIPLDFLDIPGLQSQSVTEQEIISEVPVVEVAADQQDPQAEADELGVGEQEGVASDTQADGTEDSEIVQVQGGAQTKLAQQVEDLVKSVKLGQNDVLDYFLSNDEDAFAGGVTLDLQEDEFHEGLTFGLDKLKKLKKKGLPLLAGMITMMAMSGAIEAETVRMVVEAIRSEAGLPTVDELTGGITGDSLNAIDDLNFRGLEKTAEAAISGTINGEVFFIQNYDSNGDARDVVVAGTLESIEPGDYKTQVVESAKVADDCSLVDDQTIEDPAEGVPSFTVDDTRQALIFLTDATITLEGDENIFGKTAVVRSTASGDILGCGRIIKHEMPDFDEMRV